MKNYPGLAVLGCALLAAVPAGAGNYFDFTGTGGNTNDTLSGIAGVPGGTITATAYAFEATGTTSPTTNLFGPTSGGGNVPSVGVYSGTALGFARARTKTPAATIVISPTTRSTTARTKVQAPHPGALIQINAISNSC